MTPALKVGEWKAIIIPTYLWFYGRNIDGKCKR